MKRLSALLALFAFVWCSAPANAQYYDGHGNLKSNDYPTQGAVLTSSSPTSCHSAVSVGGTTAIGLGTFLWISYHGPTLSVYPTLYDEGASPTCAQTDRIWGDGSAEIPGNGQNVLQPWPLQHGLAYQLTGSLPSGGYILIAGIW